MRGPESDFEFERRFFARQLPAQILLDASRDLIVQTYFLAAQGYALRVRLQVTGLNRPIPDGLNGKQALQDYADDFDLCMLAAKGPYVGGTRYEAERELDVSVGVAMCSLGGLTLAKERYGVWLGEDGWVIDRFLGANSPLVVAECERTGPVTNLRIPSFCADEVTDDPRFSNDQLVAHPFSDWCDEYLTGLELGAPRYGSTFGANRLETN